MRKYSLSGIRGSHSRSRMTGSDDLRDRLAVERVLEHLARLEGQNAAGGNRNFFPRLRIPADPRLLLADHEVAEAGDLDLLAALEGFLDAAEDGLDDLRRLLLGEPADLLVNGLDDVGLGHLRHPP